MLCTSVIPSFDTFLVVLIIITKLNLPLDLTFLKDRNKVSPSSVPRIMLFKDSGKDNANVVVLHTVDFGGLII